jgi:hypothetical protein
MMNWVFSEVRDVFSETGSNFINIMNFSEE